MRYTILFILFFLSYSHAAAHTPVLVEQQTVDDITAITEPTNSRAYYGELLGFPHTFEIHAEESFDLFVQILQPDIPSSVHNISGIVIKEVETGGVTEVARLHSEEAQWESFFEPFGGDRYLQGPAFEQHVDAGVYRIEVSTPDNIGKYVLSVGKQENLSGIGPLETLRRVAQVKEFYGKPPIRVFESLLVYAPLLMIGTGGALIWFFRRRRRHASSM